MQKIGGVECSYRTRFKDAEIISASFFLLKNFLLRFPVLTDTIDLHYVPLSDIQVICYCADYF